MIFLHSNDRQHTVFKSACKGLSMIRSRTGFVSFCIFLISLIGTENGIASEIMNFVQLDGALLPSNEVRNLYQDHEGYIWISTYDGLLRYDGYSTNIYKPKVDNIYKSGDVFINGVAQDMEGHLWIASQNGLYVLHKATGEYRKVVSSVLQGICYIETVICTESGDLWIGTNQGIFRKQYGSEEFERLSFEVSSLNVKSLLEDKNGYIWIGTWGSGLFRYDPVKKSLYRYERLELSLSAHTLYQDDVGNIWVGTWGNGLLKILDPYDMVHYSFVSYIHEKNNSRSLSDNIVYTIAQDHNTGKLWVGTRKALSILNMAEGQTGFTNYYPGYQRGELPFSQVNSILCGRDGLMWIGLMGGGVCTVNTNNRKFTHNALKGLRRWASVSSVKSIYQREDGKFWIGITGMGFVLYDLRNHEVTRYNHCPGLENMPRIFNVNQIMFRESTKDYCFATWEDGVWMYNGQKVKCVNRVAYPKLRDTCIYSLLEDSHGNLWIGSRSGLFMLDTEGELFSMKELAGNDGKMLSNATIFKLAEDKDGTIWAVTSDIWSIVPITSKEYRTKQYNRSLHNIDGTGVTNLCVDSYNRVWISTLENRINIYDRASDSFKIFGEDNLGKNETVFCMLEDNSGDLWVSTNSKMYRIHYPEGSWKSSIETYTTEDGLPNYMFNRNVCCKGADGQLFFGGIHGLNIFTPEKITCDSTSYPVVITDIKIFGTSVRDMSANEFRRADNKVLEYTSGVTLTHFQNNFSICFSALNYVNPMYNKYRYRLVGYDVEWKNTDAYHRSAYYNNLPSGTYRFEVRGANSNGVWSDKVCSLDIEILPYPWLAWPALLCYVLLFISGLLYGIQRLKRRARLHKQTELEELQRQKEKEIIHIKLQFFTNIAHELLTPLSIISASVDELQLTYPELKSSFAGISGNTLRLIRLIQQLLEFRKVESGCQKLVVYHGNITSFLQNSISTFLPLAHKKQLYITFDTGDREYLGYFDPDKLDKIVYNLLSNAVKYTSEGGKIIVKQHYEEEGENFTLYVNNTGELIPEEKLTSIFNRFYEGEYRKFNTTGTGIGLSLTKALVTLHHGSISIVSNAIEGNTFIVNIPIGKDAFLDEEIGDNNHEATQGFEHLDVSTETTSGLPFVMYENRCQSHIILLVEDNSELLEIMSRLLGRYFKVLQATDGNSAFEILKKQEVDLIVSDVMMPGINGYEFCHKLKSTFETAHIPVVLLTAKCSSENKVEGYRSGADGYICKPLNFSVLLAKVDSLLRKNATQSVDRRKKLVFEAKNLFYIPQDEEFLEKAVSCVNRHLDNSDFSISEFASEMGMSRTNLNDKLKELTGMTPLAFIVNIRMQAAHRLLQENKKVRITEIAYMVGFNDPKYFSICFKKKFGLSIKEMMENERQKQV